MKVLSVVGARPNFVKIAPLLREMERRPQIEPVLVHTGQHYDAAMSDVFFTDLGIRAPDRHLGREMKEGLAFVLRHRLLRAITACTGTANLFQNVAMTVTWVPA